MVFHPGVIRGMALCVPATALAHADRSLGAIVRLAADLGLPLCIENMFPGYGAFIETKPTSYLPPGKTPSPPCTYQ